MTSSRTSAAQVEREQLRDLLGGPFEGDEPAAADTQAIESGFRALAERADPALAPERLLALRDLVMLEVAPGQASPDVARGHAALGALAYAPLPRLERARKAVLAHVGPLFGVRDELLWGAGGAAITVAAVALLGIREDAARQPAFALVLPVAFPILAALYGFHMLRRGGTGAAFGAVLGGVAAVALGEHLLVAGAGGSFVAKGLACLATGASVGLFATLPIVLMHRGMPPMKAALPGLLGGLFGAAALHAHCHIADAPHSTVWHNGAVLVAGMLAVLAARLVILASPGRDQTSS